jgi:hypothetical protein
VKRVKHAVERKKRLRLKVVAIDPATYPLLRDDPSHPFSGMEPERRLTEIVSFCGCLWARACEEAARKYAKKCRSSEAA